MRHKLVVGVIGLGLVLGTTLAHAAGDPAKGKLLFASPTLGGGKSGKSCQSCHADGKNLSPELFAPGRTFTMGGKPRHSLAEVVNFCIENPLAGQAIDPNGEEMANIIAYLQTIVKGKPALRKKTEGC